MITEYVTDETKQANPDEEVAYAESSIGRTVLEYYGETSDFPDGDKRGYHLVCRVFNQGYKVHEMREKLTEDEARDILHNTGGWEYTE